MIDEVLASGVHWSVRHFVCRAGPKDRRFEERHDRACVAFVVEGSFQYRTRTGSALLAPGGALLGNAGECFECGHDHAVGDRCISFGYAPACLDEIAEALPGVTRTAFAGPSLPPTRAMLPLVAVAEMLRHDRDEAAFEELAFRIGGAALAMQADGRRAMRPSRARDEQRITDIVRLIEARSAEPWSLTSLSREAGMGAYRFLRVFARVVGMTPHQYLLRTRLHRVAIRLGQRREPILAVALEEGFADLSTFNRRFRQLMGVTPRAYRDARRWRS